MAFKRTDTAYQQLNPFHHMSHCNNPPLLLQRMLDSGHEALLCGGLKGIEKESLRIATNGKIAQTQHPSALGAALTHPFITTDYSEALIELITPPFADIKHSLAYLDAIHQFVYSRLDQEMLLATSMPCGIDGDESIRIAEYGSSNVGRMKHVYRQGLWHRYGRTMQAIAGIHFNYSAPEALWPILLELTNSPLDLGQFTAEAYFGLIRNFQRVGWIILYLFGASPAICKNFFKSRPSLMAQFEEFDSGTVYHPYATSLRMSDIGYKSKNQANLKIDYNSIDGYVKTLTAAISTPYPDYEKIGVIASNGEYQQLNCNILQIENEFYSTIRPKQIAESCEKPTLALKRRGVRYVEMRSLDLNVFNPIGIDENTARFVEALLLTCLFTDSPAVLDHDRKTFNNNQLAVANSGRLPGLMLEKNGQKIPLPDWANEILASMQTVCRVLDQNLPERPYTMALQEQVAVANNPALTASAKMLEIMGTGEISFACFGINQSRQHQAHFASRPPDGNMEQLLVDMARQSHLRQKEIEDKPQLPFQEFLDRYFSQIKA